MFQINQNEEIIQLEHTLRGLARWEEIYTKPFLTSDDKTHGEIIAYMSCSVVSGNLVQEEITTEDLYSFIEYMNKKPTATKISNPSTSGPSTTYMSSELMYATMCIAHIPWEAQDWNLNRLQVLISTIHEMQSEKKPLPKREVIESNRRLNAERKKKLGIKG